MKRFRILAAGVAIGALVVGGMSAWNMLPWSNQKPTIAVSAENPGHHHNESTAHEDAGLLTLSDDQLVAAGIELAEVRGGVLQHHFLVPGTITSDADRIARISVRLLGTVYELLKGVGDPVEKGEVVAVIESREVADAKSEFLGARLTNDLQQTLAIRQKNLWDSRATSENDYLRSRLTAQDAQIKFDSARQKLFALGLSDAEIGALPQQPVETLRLQALRSPIRGRVAERRVDLGALVGREGQESELFVIVDLDQVWAELAISPGDLPKITDRSEMTISATATGMQAKAKVVFVSPLLDKETRNARVIAALPNPDHQWRPGSYVTAEIPLGGDPAQILIPKTAMQTLKGEPVVFVRKGAAFDVRKVKVGREDDDRVEILSGLSAGETIAVANSFTLKAELGKSEAVHEH